MSRILSLIAYFCLVMVSADSFAQKSDFNQQMYQIAQKYFVLRPIIASYYGLSDEEAGMGTKSKSSYFDQVTEQARRGAMRKLIEDLQSIDRTKLTDKELVSLRLVEIELSSAYKPATIVEYGSVLGEYGVWFSPYPISHLSGVHVEIPAYMVDKFVITNDLHA